MIVTIILTSLAFYWLLVETKCLTIRLTGLDFDCSDYQMDYDGSDCVYLDDYQKQFENMINENLEQAADEAYEDYLIEQSRKVKPTRAPGSRFSQLANLELTAEMRANRMTQNQMFYRSL
jgi:hypothetical protein